MIEKYKVLAPIVVFTYNRPQHTRKALESLMQADLSKDSVLFIYADGPKDNASIGDLEKIKRTREVIREKQWCKEVQIIESKKNKGLAKSIIFGVTEVVNKFGKVIVLEDDLILSKNFLLFMNAALDKYENEPRVMQVSGYMFPVEMQSVKNDALFLPFTSSWGWATWKRGWDFFDENMTGLGSLENNSELRKRFNLDNAYPYYKMLLSQKAGKIDSWAIRFYLSVFLQHGLVLFPKKTLVFNCGLDGSGVHCKTGMRQANITNNFSVITYDEVAVKSDAMREIVIFLKGEMSFLRRASRFAGQYLFGR